MKTIKSLKDITTLEVGDKVVFGNLEYEVVYNGPFRNDYYLDNLRGVNDAIFEQLNINKKDFVEKLGINANCYCDFPETKSLEALTAIVSALFKEYEKQNELPKTWDEFCEKNKIKNEESYISIESQIRELCTSERDSITDRNVCTSKSEAKAFLALMQLRQLRKAYVKDWEPDWTSDADPKYCVYFYGGYIKIGKWGFTSQVLSFPTDELAHQFLTNFKNLIEIAKPLI
jgi:hypothetical protein